MSARKTWERVLGGSRNISFGDFEALLRGFGFVHKRTKGSHAIWAHPRVPRPLVIQSRGGQAKPYQVGQLMSAVEEYGLSLERD
jgi:predicted RNA binding protein YcfA (HicA-like mRNA interferase family)